MRVIYPVCCGIDVHKSFLMATIISTRSDAVTPKYERKKFLTFNNQILALKKWLLENNCRHVCMESTGKYWIPVYNLLEDEINVTIANPKWVRAVKGNKDDKKDSKWIGELFRFGLVKGSFIPRKEIRILREYTRYRTRLVSHLSSEKNRLQNAFTVGNVAMDSVLSDMFGVSAKKIRDYLITTKDFDPEHCLSLLHRNVKNKDSLIDSIEGYFFTPEQLIRIQIIEEHIAYLNNTIAFLDSRLDKMAEPHEAAIQLLCTIPGIKCQSAIQILSEIGDDMSQFESSEKLCAWAGLSPSNNESAGKKKSVRISRAGVYLKPALVQCAHAAVKAKEKNPYYRLKYERIYKRRGKKRGIIAVARMILTAIFHMLSTGEVWNPSDLYKIDMPDDLVQKQKDKAVKQAIKLLIAEGLLSEIPQKKTAEI